MKILRFFVLGWLAVATLGHAQDSDPGWYISELQTPIIPAISFSTTQPQVHAYGLSSPVPSVPVAEVITPQIQALADGLQDNPTNIFDYVHDHIKFVLYFGSKKGAALTLLERSGNDFDQCALLVALLSAAGYSNSVAYQFGWQLIPYDDPFGENRDLHHWWQLQLSNTNWAATLNYLGNLVEVQRGYPLIYQDPYLLDGDYTNNILIQRTWVELTVGSTTYQLDPAFKVSAYQSGISLTNVIGNTVSNALMSAAAGTDTGTYTRGLQESAVRQALTGYTTNLLNYLQSNAPNSSVRQILGGWQIVPADNPLDFSVNTTFLTVNPNGQMPIQSWTYEPTNLMSTLQIGFAGTNYLWFMPQLQGQRLTLTFSNNGVAQLWQEDTPLAQGATSGSGSTSVVLAVTHPFGSWDTANNVFIPNPTNVVNQTITNAYQRTNATYNLMYAFEPDWNWLGQRQAKLNAYQLSGLPATSRQVVSETLNVMGLQWLLETEANEQLFAGQLNILPDYLHRIGRMAQEGGNGYYVDAYLEFSYAFPSAGVDAADVAKWGLFVNLTSYFNSALEHGIIEQLQSSNLMAASTMKMLEIASTNGQSIYLATSNNWSAISGQFTNYGSALGTIHTNYINNGFYVLLPVNGSNSLSGAGSWTGYGYVAYLPQGSPGTIKLAISGNYQGGFSGSPAPPSPTDVAATDDNQDLILLGVPFLATETTAGDPIDTARGTFKVEHTDLSLGQSEPRGITLSRYYNGVRRSMNPAGMAGGWLHNYWVNANTVAAAQAGLGGTTPAQAAPMIVASFAAIQLFNQGQADPENWTLTALIAKWGVDQLDKNGVSINSGKDLAQFIKQPNGAFTPPPNSTMTLTQSNGLYRLQERHGNTFNFDSLGRLSTLMDPYGPTLTVTYLNSTSSLPQTVTDWKGRTLTFNYTGGQLTSVSDSTGRTVSYGYSTSYNAQSDLTSFTDAENKTTSYAYDTNHDITATIDAASRLVISNAYNTQGQIATQWTEGLTNKAWRVFWSGWQNVFQDPAGGQQSYFYDDQTRLVAQEDALGNTNELVYDGQNHIIQTVSPLNETNQFLYDGNNNLIQSVDPLGHTSEYVYDANNDLIEMLDPLSHASMFGYNAQFSMISQTNGAGDWVNYVYNSNGTLDSRTDAGGTTTYGYDAYGQLNSLTYPGSLGSESFVNSALGDVTSHTDGKGNITMVSYNARRQLTNSVGPTNVFNQIAYDAVGNVADTTDARTNITSNSWSATRHLLTTTFPATPQGTPVVTNGYDVRDWLTSMADPLLNWTYYTNDPDQHLITTTDPLKRATQFYYDADGHRLATVNAQNETNSQTFDARGLVISQTDGAGHVILSSNDAAGNQIILTNRNGKKWQFQFDGANRLTFTISPLGRSNSMVFNHQGLVSLATDQLGQPTHFYYDAKGRLTNRTDNLASTAYGHDLNDNLTGVTEGSRSNVWTYDAYNRVTSYQDVNGYTIGYHYDANGNLTNLVYPGGKNVYYAYDSLNRLTNVTDWSSRETILGYDLDSHLTSIIRPNGSFRTISYDAAGQVTNIWEQMANSLPIAWFRLNWTNAGTVAWEFAAPLPHTNSPPVRKMTYDADNRLQTFQGPTMGSAQNVGVDLDGNLTNGPLINDTLTNYTYDARNRLLSVGGVANSYDAMNNRIGQTAGTNATTYVVNPNASLPQVLMRFKNGVTTYYIYGAGLLYQITEAATGTNTLTYHYDYRGSTIALSADSGLVTDRMEYSLYGSTTYRGGTNDTPFLYNGRYGVQTDPGGLLYMGARYYNPYLCRFINPDPSGFKGGLNLYAYANGNPVSYSDPYGLNATATGDSDNSTLIDYSAGQMYGQPCVACHGVSAFGYNGDPNSFVGLSAIPGSGENAQLGYQGLEDTAIMAAPFVAGPVGGYIGASLDIALDSAVVATGVGVSTATATITVNLAEGEAALVVTYDGEVIAQTPISFMATHADLAAENGALAADGSVAPGYWVGTVSKINGQVVGFNSFSLYGNMSPNYAATTVLQTVFH